mmetsp:Transcript_6165/g.13973  ORF Transcript_6165/g.13973 Transcript_6165/m.13973 type:complete len:121 (-) Transcript_6165:1204-1566(-)
MDHRQQSQNYKRCIDQQNIMGNWVPANIPFCHLLNATANTATFYLRWNAEPACTPATLECQGITSFCSSNCGGLVEKYCNPFAHSPFGSSHCAMSPAPTCHAFRTAFFVTQSGLCEKRLS